MMSEECGIWLSTSRPPKGLHQAKKHKGATSKTNLSNKLVTTTFFSAILTQNSPPPPQLLTSRKQSHLTDYFRKENECRVPKNKPYLTDVQSQLKTENTSNDKSDIINVNLDLEQPSFLSVTESSDFFSSESVHSTRKLCPISSPKKLKHLNKQHSSFTHFNNKENICDQQTLLPKEYLSTSSGSMLINEYVNSNLDQAVHPNKLLRLKDNLESARVSEGISFLDNITNSDSNISDRTRIEFGHESNSESLTFSSDDDDQFTINDSTQSIFKEQRMQNEEFFHARRQKHFMDMETLTFTNDSTE